MLQDSRYLPIGGAFFKKMLDKVNAIQYHLNNVQSRYLRTRPEAVTAYPLDGIWLESGSAHDRRGASRRKVSKKAGYSGHPSYFRRAEAKGATLSRGAALSHRHALSVSLQTIRELGAPG